MSTIAIAPDRLSRACAPAVPATHSTTDEFLQVETPPAIPLSAAIRRGSEELIAASAIRVGIECRISSGEPVRRLHYLRLGLINTSHGFIAVMAALRREFTCVGDHLPAGAPMVLDWEHIAISISSPTSLPCSTILRNAPDESCMERRSGLRSRWLPCTIIQTACCGPSSKEALPTGR